MELTEAVEKSFGHRLRLRVGGICWQDNKLLLIKHRAIGPTGVLYAPPAGGAEYGQSLQENLQREFKEEAGLEVEVQQFKFVYEYKSLPLHAIELYFNVIITGGRLHSGSDPELSDNQQIIEEAGFMEWNKIKAKPPDQLHAMLRFCSKPEDLKQLSGELKFDS